MRKILIVLGPTAVGKTALSVNIAKEFDGYILSADSVQVYKGLDIISGKEKNSYGDVPVFLLDIISPLSPFNISDYITHFKQTILDDKSNLPIITGGSAFYLSALLNGVETVDIKPDENLREVLEKLSVTELQNKLQECDPNKLESMNNSDRNNPRRLIRAIEISQDKSLEVKKENMLENFNVKIVGLTSDAEILDRRVDARVTQRMEQGALNEAKDLFAEYDSLASQVKTASGYAQLFSYLKGEVSLTDAIEKWKIAEHQNVRKQLTWFKKFKNVEWFHIQNEGYQEEIIKLVSEWN